MRNLFASCGIAALLAFAMPHGAKAQTSTNAACPTSQPLSFDRPLWSSQLGLCIDLNNISSSVSILTKNQVFVSGVWQNWAGVLDGSVNVGLMDWNTSSQAHADLLSPTPAGTNIIGKVGIDQTTPGTTNAVQPIPGTSGGLTNFVLEPVASDNHTVIKNGAGQVYAIQVFNNSATINYVRLYNAGTGFNGCNSATNLVWEGHIPANATNDAGFIYSSDVGIPFATGISICVTGGYGQTNVTNATASAISLNVQYK